MDFPLLHEVRRKKRDLGLWYGGPNDLRGQFAARVVSSDSEHPKPSFASSFAVSSPMPEVAPVITMVFMLFLLKS